jgi:hypothetical protein
MYVSLTTEYFRYYCILPLFPLSDERQEGLCLSPEHSKETAPHPGPTPNNTNKYVINRVVLLASPLFISSIMLPNLRMSISNYAYI